MTSLRRMSVLLRQSLSRLTPLSAVSCTHLQQLHSQQPSVDLCTLTKTSAEQQGRLPVVPVFRQALSFPAESIAVRDAYGEYTYRGLFLSSRQLADQLTDSFAGRHGERVAFLAGNEATYLIIQWACWMSGQTAVPLSSVHPPQLLEYFISDSDAGVVVATTEHADTLRKAAGDKRKFIVLDSTLRTLSSRKADQLGSENVTLPEEAHELKGGGQEPEFYDDNDALFIYTSGTTGPPKGVVLTYRNLDAQAQSLIKAWEWSSKDSILHTLPLHHIHGVVNALLCPLLVGARVVMLPKFDAPTVWAKLLALNTVAAERVNIFMGVPTMYVKLIQEYDHAFGNNERMKEYIHSVCSQKIRLMVSGSAPLPAPIMERWEEITGHRLLERYGMSETGMILSNPLHGERKPGSVGHPLPGVTVRLSDSGEVQVKGDNVFSRYWNRPQATAKEFTEDGWFKTGDTAVVEDGYYRLLGRTSVDVIKTGGYKVGAVDIEAKLLAHPALADVAVLGVEDPTWGQRVVAVVVPEENKTVPTLAELREWAKGHMAPYAIPTQLKVIEQLPRNAMGKVNKKDLIKQLFPSKSTGTAAAAK
ncbi:malonate--CoA ligase ACSF3, mitochondrial isoform X3 [Schistocerca gregaria]|uniref:malonate--CoA ligase ACSF3, mitochondrial isoform X3 n=1 Tax=Schistocerca gregaria TaxID=7010 RepID=UPI00211EE4B5|nr:malonate--CoA ligase ACSF3, mitochondrial isoform X3 [Schistocerca gregaria]XP_049833481.1 malonate--CoA ligase ACSF3, mitochondrial isoform X3 [Schistocerca gregaria]